MLGADGAFPKMATNSRMMKNYGANLICCACVRALTIARVHACVCVCVCVCVSEKDKR